jgi:hypothetical protein
MTTKENIQLEGYFISFSPDELKAVNDQLQLLDYTRDSQGLRNFLLDAMFEDAAKNGESDTERVIRKARDYVKKNPEKIRLALDTVRGLAGMIRKPRH